MMVETARQHEISSVEFSSTMLEPTGKSEFSKSARFGCERAEHFGIGAPKIFITSHGELIAPKGISMCNPAPVRPTDEISSFPASWRNAKYFDISAFLRWHFYRQAFLLLLLLLYAILGFRNTVEWRLGCADIFQRRFSLLVFATDVTICRFCFNAIVT